MVPTTGIENNHNMLLYMVFTFFLKLNPPEMPHLKAKYS